jgi:formylglycine-generating enzyme required for sulfatase activity
MKALVALLCAGLLYGLHGPLEAAPGDELYTRPGQLVEADGTRLNLYCTGSGSPAVVFDSGWEDWAPVWTIVQPEVARWTRACSYDRAGAGFSDPGPLPRTSVRIADELHSALHHAGIRGPYILVGNAFGGDNVRTFAERYTGELAGLVMVEADVGGPAEHRGDAAIVAGLRACRDAIAAGKPLPMLPARPGRPPRNCTQQFFRGLPEAMWSRELNARLLELAQTKVAMYDAYISEMEQMPEDEAYLAQHEHSLGSRPIRVLSTGNHGVHFLDPTRAQDAAHQQYEQEVARAQAKWLELSSNARQLFTDQSSEYIPFDQPAFVIDAIHEVYSESTAHPSVSVFRDCAACPEMVVIPAGRFTMGSSPAEQQWAVTRGATPKSVSDESPQHTVAVPSFALGRYPVTRGDYAAFAHETGYPGSDGCGRTAAKWIKDATLSWQKPGFAQDDRDPVVCVSWHDALAYIGWLNGKVPGRGPGSGPYRLPTESEWEYAARAGSSTYFWWGDDESKATAYAWFKANADEHTHPVGLKPANAFGLYDVIGNVWQWTADCYAENYTGAASDGRAYATGNDCLRVDRGGSWQHPAWLLRSAPRERNPADFRAVTLGFRLAHDASAQ